MSRDEFQELYQVAFQFKYSMAEDRCHTGNAPTLRECLQLYGCSIMTDWLLSYIRDLQAYTNAAKRLSPNQETSLAWVILTQYGSLKVTEVMLFCVKAKAGYFGKFYNTIDPMDISSALAKWLAECDRIKGDYLHRKAQEARAAELVQSGDAITPEQAVELGLVKNPLLKKIWGV